MLGLIKVAQILAALLPLVQTAVQVAESIFGPRQGLKKLDAATNVITAALPAAGATAAQIAQLVPAIREQINTVVAGLNDAGVFKKGAAPSPTAPMPAAEQSPFPEGADG